MVTSDIKQALDSPRTAAKAFFRWQTAGEPVSVVFHLNVVELLEREVSRAGSTEIAGLLLGRVQRGRKLTLVVEDCDPANLATNRDGATEGLATALMLGAMTARWQSMPERRLAVLGFYRMASTDPATPSSDTSAALRIGSADSERIFLQIEPRHSTQGTRATLSLIKAGAVTWNWPSIDFSRADLSGIKQNASGATPLQRTENSQTDAREQARPEQLEAVPPLRSFQWSANAIRGFGILSAIVAIAIGIRPMLGTQMLQHLSTSFYSPTTTAAYSPGGASMLGLQTVRNGLDWTLSWNPTTLVLLSAKSARLTIDDGILHKSLDIAPTELRSGTITYSPVTDEAVLRMEVKSDNSTLLASESVRIVAGAIRLPSFDAAAVALEPSKRAKQVAGGTRATTSIKAPTRPSNSEASNLESLLPLMTADRAVSLSAGPKPDLVPIVASVTPETIPTESVTSSALRGGDFIPAKLLLRSEPVYPQIAKLSRQTGKVELVLTISAQGTVRASKVIKGPAALTQASLEAVRKWKYQPARLGGAPAESEVPVTFIFKLN